MSEKTITTGRPLEFEPEAVLDAVMALFWRRGFEATSMQDLESCTGLSRSSLYNSFGSKRELFERAIGRYERRGRAIAALEEGVLGLEDVHAFFDRLVAALRAARSTPGCFMVNSVVEFGGKDAAMARTGKEYFDRVQAALAKALRRAARRGEIAGAGVESRARLLLAIAVGMNVHARAGATGEDLATLAEAAHAQIRAWRSKPEVRKRRSRRA
jgi:AcrR family transcriptional regulator